MNLFLFITITRSGIGSFVLGVTIELFVSLCLTVNGETLEKRGTLIKTLLKDYDSWSFPGNATVVVGASLLSLNKGYNDIDPLVTNILLKQLWFDPRLQWDPKQFGGQSVLSIPSREVWKPEVKLLNSVSLPSIESCAQSKVTIRSTGQVLWATPCQFQSLCSSSESFGNGPLNCSLKFGAWAWDGTIKDLLFYDYEPKLDLELFEDVTKWNVTSSSAKRVEKINRSSNDLFPVMLVFEVFIEQKQFSFTPVPVPGAPGAGAAFGAPNIPSIGSSGTADCGGGDRSGSDGGCIPGADF